MDDAGDQVIEGVNQGIDLVQDSIDYSLTANLENLTLTGGANLSGTGNSLANVITGNSGNNVLDGAGGADTLIGGGGNDTYFVDNVGDIVSESSEGGTDTVLSSVGYGLSSNVENLTLAGAGNISGTGNELDNVLLGNSGNNLIVGGAGNDLLDGGLGADSLRGGSGDDTYRVDHVGDVVSENADEGQDTALASVSYSLSEYVENLVLTGLADINGTGNMRDNRLTGNSGNNTLDGGAGNDRFIFGLGSGNDRIVDAQGNDVLQINGELTASYLEAERDGDDLTVQVIGSSETVVLANWFVQTEGVNAIEFSDGTALGRQGIEDLMNRPPVANPDEIAVHEDGGMLVFSASELLVNDTDPNPKDVLRVVSVGESALGMAVSLKDGALTYDIGNNFQSLAAGQTLNDHFSYVISDSKGVLATNVVNVSILGRNDAPVLMKALSDQYAPINREFSWQIPKGSFIDIDEGDTLRFSATLADGSALPGWLRFDAATATFSLISPKKIADYLDIQVKAVDSTAATGSAAGSLSVSDRFRVFFGHGNQGIGNGQDAPPPGHDSNWNDGPGASPGYPKSTYSNAEFEGQLHALVNVMAAFGAPAGSDANLVRTSHDQLSMLIAVNG